MNRPHGGRGDREPEFAPFGAARADEEYFRSPEVRKREPSEGELLAERVSGEEVDLYAWLPQEAYDLIAASVYQMPVDPFGQVSSHRPVDYWGRNLLDHLIGQLPQLLAENGVAYVMQLSILSQTRTAELVEQARLAARVIDYGFFPFTPIFQSHREQIQRVEHLSDAYHLTFGGEDVMIAYLLEITRRSRHSAPSV